MLNLVGLFSNWQNFEPTLGNIFALGLAECLDEISSTYVFNPYTSLTK